VRVALMYWPHMQATTVKEEPVPLSHDAESGFLTFDPVASDVRIRLPWHWSEKAGAALSGIGVLISLVFGLRARAGPRRNASKRGET